MDRIILIRHAKALKRETWKHEDLLRPLSAKGRAQAKKLTRFVARHYPQVSLLFSSNASRAIESARGIARRLGCTLRVSEEISPMCGSAGYAKLLERALKSEERACVIIGHEPDLSETLSMLCSNGNIHIKWQKAMLVELAREGESSWRIEAAIPPSAF
ncbi:MAG: SixA phosphatase family protein [Wolinella sp.]